VTFKDHRWGDTGEGFDKYRTERTYNPFEQGTFWGKFRARQPYLRGRSLRVIRGLLGQTLAQMETRHYVVESFDGPTPDGIYTLVAKDVLKLADGDRAQAPGLSPGRLLNGIDDNDASLTLTPTGSGDDYPASGHAAIGGKEIVEFTRSGDTLTITRAQKNTTAQSHSAGDRVQLVLSYDAEDPADIIRDLLVNYAGIDSDFIPLSSWQTETGTYLNRLYTADIAEPTSVAKLVSELIEQAALSIWWGDEDQLIRLRVIRQITTDAATFDETLIEKGSLQTREQPETRLSQIWTYFAKRNPLEGQEDPDNYRSVEAQVDADAEVDYGTPAIRKIFSRWIPFGGRSIAERMNLLLLSRFRDPPRRFNLRLPARTGDGVRRISPTLGDGYRLEAWPLQEPTGEADSVPIQVTRLDPAEDFYAVEAEEQLIALQTAEDLSQRTVTIDSNSYNLNLRTLHDALYSEPTGAESPPITVTFIVESGVVVGSTSTSNPAIHVGSWPTGVVLILENNGRIQGKGGAGKRGSSGSNIADHAPEPGLPGGPALYTREAITLDNLLGEIFGGGGGGGGGAGGGNTTYPDYELGPGVGRGGGGGGGSGTDGGDGGPGGKRAGGGEGGADGDPGTDDTGGLGGAKGWPESGDGGDGGDPGQPGDDGDDSSGAFFRAGATGGAAGSAIDGDSFVTITNTGDIRGPQVN
jgi:hypothetical protein